MQLKRKLAALMVAVSATAGAGSAQAAIALPSTGNGELVFTLWDSINQVSYTRDLGITLNSFFSTQNNPLSFAADAVLTSFLSGLSATSRANLLWSVVSTGDSVAFGTQTTNPQTGVGNGQRYLTTVNGAAVLPSNAQLSNLQTTVYFANQNALPGHQTADGSAVISSTENAAAYGGSFGSDWNGRLSFNISGAVGQSLGFISMVTSRANITGTNGTAPAATYQFNTAGAPNMWTFGNDGSLVYAPVPEPSAYALMLAGLLTIGAVARRRMK